MPIKVRKGGVDYHLLPAPLVNYEKTFQSAANGQILGAGYTITLDGTLIANKGNPVASGISGVLSTDSWTTTFSSDDDPLHGNTEQQLLSAIIAKQQKIHELFASGSAIDLTIYGFGESSGISCYANVQSVTFPAEGRWALPSPYTITLQTNNIGLPSESYNYFISDAQENWAIQEDGQVKVNFNGYAIDSINKVYSVNHTISAVGKPVYTSGGGYLNDMSPWQQASGYVQSTLGLGSGGVPLSLIPSKIIGSGYLIANRKVDESIDELGGSYGVTESYIAYKSGTVPYAALETMTVSVDQGEDGTSVFAAQGTIQGLDTNQNTAISVVTNAYFNANNYYSGIQADIYQRAKTISGFDWVHPVPLSRSTSKDPAAGSVSYSMSYNDRPPNIVPSSISENITINDTYPGQLFAVIPVIGRSTPVLQHLNSRSEYRRSLNIDIVMSKISNNWSTNASNGYWSGVSYTDIKNWLLTQKPSVTQSTAFQAIFDAANPANDSAIASKVFYSAPIETWNPRQGTYSYSIEWIFER